MFYHSHACEELTKKKQMQEEVEPLLSNLDNNELYEYCIIIMCMYLGVYFLCYMFCCIDLHPNALFS